MSDYKFSESERVAIWRADGEKCFYCSTPIRYNELQIDQVVPERISANKLEELRPTLPAKFKINSIENWVSCHQGWNIRKSSLVFDTNAILYYIQMATNRAGKVRKTLDEFEIGRENDRLLSALTVRIEQGHLKPSGSVIWSWESRKASSDADRSMGYRLRYKLLRPTAGRRS